jgi:hypothetical protein
VKRSLNGRSPTRIPDVEDGLFMSASVATYHLELSRRNLEGDEELFVPNGTVGGPRECDGLHVGAVRNTLQRGDVRARRVENRWQVVVEALLRDDVLCDPGKLFNCGHRDTPPILERRFSVRKKRARSGPSPAQIERPPPQRGANRSPNSSLASYALCARHRN